MLPIEVFRNLTAWPVFLVVTSNPWCSWSYSSCILELQCLSCYHMALLCLCPSFVRTPVIRPSLIQYNILTMFSKILFLNKVTFWDTGWKYGGDGRRCCLTQPTIIHCPNLVHKFRCWCLYDATSVCISFLSLIWAVSLLGPGHLWGLTKSSLWSRNTDCDAAVACPKNDL